MDRETEEIKTFDDFSTNNSGSIAQGIAYLASADVLIGHNVLAFDIPAIEKLYPKFKSAEVLDTLILSRMTFPDIKTEDFECISVNASNLPRNLIGRHSLEAWGHRLGVHKGTFGKEGGAEVWDNWSKEMVDYCVTDVILTLELLNYAMTHVWSPSEHAVKTEHDFAKILRQQEINGINFDCEKAAKLYGKLSARRHEIGMELQNVFPPTEIEKKTPQFWFVESTDATIHGGMILSDVLTFKTKTEAKKAGYKDSQIQRGPNKTETIYFNPNSRDQIAEAFINKYNWNPREYTTTGKPKIDEKVLANLDYPEAKLLAENLLVQKRIAQLAEGDEAWLKLEQKGRIHGRINHLGTVTSRCTHRQPNIGQIPGVRSPYGKECRELFKAGKGRKMVGIDMSGLELRCLSHFLHPYDDGAYAKEVVEGDIHSRNMEAANLPNRNMAKTFIYGFLYGAGNEKIGSIVGGSRADGKKLKERFLKHTPALKQLQEDIASTVQKRHPSCIRGLDGRFIPIRYTHASLNTILQSCGAILMKKATVLAHKIIPTEWQVKQVAHVHDEIQYTVLEEFADDLGRLVVSCMRQSGDEYGFRCKLDAEYRIGNNWAETH
jgi:DNA polymerase I-like protein with 3'-5' exonuclease and polymerase domains